MYRIFALALLACLPNALATADPMHARADGAYWHHDSGWVFPERIGEFVRVGIPQDVAGSPDAVAYYACVERGGVRNTAAVDMYQASSAAAAELEGPPAGRLVSDDTFPLNAARTLTATRQIYAVGEAAALVGTYFISAGDWRVRIRISGSRPEVMDAFVREQRWDALGDH
jgi:hypothetical protein